MELVFRKLLDMSLTAGWVVLGILLLRPVLRRVSKRLTCALWLLAGIRLVCPFSVRSLFSLFSLLPSAEVLPGTLAHTVPQIPTGITPLPGQTVVPVFPSVPSSVPVPELPAENAASVPLWQTLLPVLWVVGMAGMLLYMGISCLRLYLRIREGCPMEGEAGVRVCDRIGTPFLFGVLRPVICLPSALSGEDVPFVLAHERMHKKRLDHLWKPLGFLFLTVYWFHPLLWIGYIVLCRDIEAACDEAVLAAQGDGGETEAYKKPYTAALLRCSVQSTGRIVSACPLAFGETGVKSRIRSVLNYKKPALWLIVLAVIVCVIAAVCLLTDPKQKEDAPPVPDTTRPGGEAMTVPMTEWDIRLHAVSMIYDDPVFNYVQTADVAPEFRLSRGDVFWNIAEDGTKDENAEAFLGAMRREIPDEETFLGFFSEHIALLSDAAMENGILTRLKKLRSEIAEGYRIDGTQNGLPVFFYLFRQNDGTVLLCEGFEKKSGQPDLFIRWVYQMETAVEVFDTPMKTWNVRLCAESTLYESPNPAYQSAPDMGELSPGDVYMPGNYYSVDYSSRPQYFLSQGVLYWNRAEKGHEMESSWTKLGTLVEDIPDEDTFSAMFGRLDPSFNPAAKQAILNRLLTMRAHIAEGYRIDAVWNGMELRFYLFRQNDGTVYVCQCYGDMDETWKNDIFTICKMTAVGEFPVSYSLPTDGVKTAWANWTEDIRMLFSLNAKKMYISSVQHLPLFRSETRKELDRFREQFEGTLDFNNGYDEVPSFAEVTRTMDDAFFAENTLFLVYVQASSGSLRFSVADIVRTADAVTIRVVQDPAPDAVTDDMAGWLLLVPVSKAELNGVTEFDAYLGGE